MKQYIFKVLGYSCLGMALLCSGTSLFLLTNDWGLAERLEAQGLVEDEDELQRLRDLEADLEQSTQDFALQYGAFREVKDPTTKLALTQYSLARDKQDEQKAQSIYGLCFSQLFTIVGFLILGIKVQEERP